MWRRTRWRPTDKRAKVERGQREATLLGWAPGHRACLASGSPEHAQTTHGSPRAAGGTSASPSLWGGEASGTQGLGRGGCSCRPTATSDHEEPAEPSTGSPPRATQRPRSAVCTPSTRATGRNVSTAQARLALSAASRAATPAGPRRHQVRPWRRAPAAQDGLLVLRGEIRMGQLPRSAPPSHPPHTQQFRQLVASACRGGGDVISYLVAPILLGSAPGWVVPEYKGVAYRCAPPTLLGPAVFGARAHFQPLVVM